MKKLDNQRNRFDTKDSLEIGLQAERAFLKLAMQKNYIVEEASSKANINEHYDFIIKKADKEYKVEVKAMKRIQRNDEAIQDDWFWVELHGVRRNDRGWLFDGKADLIAIETNDSFILVQRKDLIKLVTNIVDMKDYSRSAKNAKYKVYQRSGRLDKITLIRTSALNTIKHTVWMKE